ncbi:MAG TPA: hypothetical protein VHC68_01915 [Candidatus Paceibacterota bacterium]|nr:hypothetical protein [Candidatus Paceibacterota bacterium]
MRSAVSRPLLALALLGPLLFPWPLCAALALAAAFYYPFAPAVAGVILDALYFSRGAAPSWGLWPHGAPLYTLCGLAATFLALLVHRFVETSIMTS